jgi:hypothetical protein
MSSFPMSAIAMAAVLNHYVDTSWSGNEHVRVEHGKAAHVGAAELVSHPDVR